MLVVVIASAMAIGQAQTPAKPKKLTLEMYFEMESVNSPQLSPDGKQIIYARGWTDKLNDRRRTSLWIMNADGSMPKQLTDLNAREGMPRFSPDGKRIVFHSNRTGNEQDFDLFTMKLDGSDVVNLTEHFAFDQMPHWGK